MDISTTLEYLSAVCGGMALLIGGLLVVGIALLVHQEGDGNAHK